MGQIVITGASSDIGRAIVEKLSLLGKPMVLHCNRNPDPLLPWEKMAEVVVADFSKEEDVDRFLSRMDDVEILVNAAACTITELIPQMSLESIHRMVEVNIVAFTRICQAVIPAMCINRRGILVHISSATASKVFRGQSVYGGTKAYIEAFSKAIVAEYGRKGIRSNCVSPGSIDAGTLSMLRNIMEDKVKGFNAMNALGTPRNVADAVAFLCSPEAAFVNGTVLHVDGGHWSGI